MIRFCSFATADRLPHLRLLAAALARHHPASPPLMAVVVGGARTDEPFATIDLADTDPPVVQELAADQRWAEVVQVLQPRLLERLLADGADVAVWLDAAVDVLAPLEPVECLVASHPLAVAMRLAGDPPIDDRQPDVRQLRAAGRVEPGMVAAAPAAGPMLEWWANRAAPAGRTPSRPGRWLQTAPSAFRDLGIVSDPGCGLSAWNAHQRRLERDGDTLLANGRRLRYLHLDSFDPTRPFLIYRGFDRTALSDEPLLAEVCADYARRLLEAGWKDTRRSNDIGRLLPNGSVFDDRLARLHAEAAAGGANFGDVFSPSGCEAFGRWLAEPAPRGAGHGVTRYLFHVYRERDDVIRAYPDLDGPDGSGFAGWAWVFGAREMDIPERYLPPRPQGIDPPEWIKRRDTPLTGPPERLPRGSCPAPAVNVVGILHGTLGLGEAARGYVRALKAVGVPVGASSVDLRTLVGPGAPAHDEGYGLVDFEELEQVDSGFNLVCVNADELPRFADWIGESFFREHPTIGVWAWETDRIPDRWAPAFRLVDEIWVYSSYVAENLGRVSPVPVVPVPPPVVPPDPAGASVDLGVPPGFRFLFMFDFLSTIQRKNPVGLIEAFRSAFARGEGPQLVVKTINGRHRFEALEEVRWAARGRPDVHVVDHSLSPRARDALLVSCDCYLSLHRSEGFGLTLAECMALGKPVIGTAYSATTDFMTEENSYPVSHGMTRVGADCEIYPASGTWAEPNLAEAAAQMRRVLERPDEARARGERARADIERLYSPAAVGKRARARLEELRGLWV
ncbi:MAG: glycosyltransferase [Thermoleophilaceae bacterium]